MAENISKQLKLEEVKVQELQEKKHRVIEILLEEKKICRELEKENKTLYKQIHDSKVNPI